MDDGLLGVLEQRRTLESASHFVVLLCHRASAVPGRITSPASDSTSVFTPGTWDGFSFISASREHFCLSLTPLPRSTTSPSYLSSSSSSSSSSVSEQFSSPVSFVSPRMSPATFVIPAGSFLTDRSSGPSLERVVCSSACWMCDSSDRIFPRCAHRWHCSGRDAARCSVFWYSCSNVLKSCRSAAAGSVSLSIPLCLASSCSDICGGDETSLRGLWKHSLIVSKYHSSTPSGACST